MKKLSDYLSPFQEIDLSSILGISSDEYAHLHHDPLYQYKNNDGEIVVFFMHVRPYNPKEILIKMNLDGHFIATFKPEDIFALRRMQLPITEVKKHKAMTSFRTLEAAH